MDMTDSEILEFYKNAEIEVVRLEATAREIEEATAQIMIERVEADDRQGDDVEN